MTALLISSLYLLLPVLIMGLDDITVKPDGNSDNMWSKYLHSLVHLAVYSRTHLITKTWDIYLLIILCSFFSGCILTFQNQTFPCAYGRNGVTLNKVEGDGCTPIGSYPLRRVFYRSGIIENYLPFATSFHSF